MTAKHIHPGRLMAVEAAEALQIFAKSAMLEPDLSEFDDLRAIYTVARGSSDAVANILSYEFMRALRVPVTSLPPSIFSIGTGVALDQAGVMVISQSGASDDLVQSAKGAVAAKARVLAITNQPGSPVEQVATRTIPINAGPERAVPATKSVCGSIGAGLAALAALVPDYAASVQEDARTLGNASTQHSMADTLQPALLRARHVYVIGRDTGYGAAIEVALKLKECCAIHAEAYSASEVLHGPLQLATNPLTVLILDTGTPKVQDSLDKAQARFISEGCDVHRVGLEGLGQPLCTPGAAAAYLLAVLYPIILSSALALGHNPDAPRTLSKVTQTL